MLVNSLGVPLVQVKDDDVKTSVTVQDTLYFHTAYIRAKFLYQCEKKQNHFPGAALHS